MRELSANANSERKKKIIQQEVGAASIITKHTCNNITILRESILESCFVSVVRKTCSNKNGRKAAATRGLS
jgi:hypothetical protein